MTAPIVGIDLGTSNSVVAVSDQVGNVKVLSDDHGYKVQPSVVSFHPNGSVIVGAEAKQRKVLDPKNTVFSAKRLIGRPFRSREVHTSIGRVPYVIREGGNQQPMIVTRAGEFAIPEISAIVLDHMRKLASRTLGGDVNRAVITVPASFTEAQRTATATAGAIAGLTVMRVLNEPTAAALAYGHARQLRRTIAVYDFGGGTFDITVLKLDGQIFEVLGTAGDSFLGGDDLDERVVDQLVAAFLAQNRIDLRQNEIALMRLRAVAEQTKIELSRRSRAIIKVDEIAYGPGGKPLHLQQELTRDALVAGCVDVIDRTFPVCEESLRLAGVRAADIDDVVLVGGTTKMPYVRDRVAAFFGKAPRTDISPEEAIAIGAALQAASMDQLLAREPSVKVTASQPIPRVDLPDSYSEITATDATRPESGRMSTIDQEPTGSEVFDLLGDAVPEPVPTPTVPRTTARIGNSTMRPPATSTARTPPDRPVQRGSQVDRIDARNVATGPPGAPIGRMTKPGAAPPPVPPGAAPPATLVGVASQPTVTRDSQFDVPTRPGEPIRPLDGEPTKPKAPVDSLLAAAGAGAAAAATAATMLLGDSLRPSTPTATTMRGLAQAPRAEPSPGSTDRGVPPPGMQHASQLLPPMVLEVTPRAFGIATVAGYCEELIRRNARVPTQMRKTFITSRDLQQTVRIRICQGESRRLDDNVVIGDLVLDRLDPRPRGEVSIEVTFVIDASGILNVTARDPRSGREQQASLDIIGAQSESEVDASRDRLAALRR